MVAHKIRQYKSFDVIGEDGSVIDDHLKDNPETVRKTLDGTFKIRAVDTEGRVREIPNPVVLQRAASMGENGREFAHELNNLLQVAGGYADEMIEYQPVKGLREFKDAVIGCVDVTKEFFLAVHRFRDARTTKTYVRTEPEARHVISLAVDLGKNAGRAIGEMDAVLTRIHPPKDDAVGSAPDLRLKTFSDYYLTLEGAVSRAKKLLEVYEGTTLGHTLVESISPVDLSEIALSSLREISLFGDFADVPIIQNISDGLPKVAADPDRLRQVGVNLIKNAAESCVQRRETERGGEPLGGVEVRPLYVSTFAEGGNSILEVRDEGMGITPENLQRIITEGDLTTKPTGHALGLRASRKIVESYGGRLEIESAGYLMGATVRMVLPAQN
ncbi:Adaptive-response sensory-kinase SasA [uncultured archaeon]|nr:Adaptive-response sensory-kinase SasA [uncultured archaeon]